MEIIYENSEIWGDAMRESCSQVGLLSLCVELHLQKVSTSSVRRSTSRVIDQVFCFCFQNELSR